jgi:hypothetical protein
VGGTAAVVERRIGGTTVVRYGPTGTGGREGARITTAALWRPLLAAPGAMAAIVLQRVASQSRPLGIALAAVTVAGAAWLWAGSPLPARPAWSVAGMGGRGEAPAASAGQATAADASVAALLVGRSGHIGGGAWAARAGAARVRLQTLAQPPADASPGEAVAAARRLLQGQYGAVDVVAAQYVAAALLGPEESGTSEAAGVTAPDEAVMDWRHAWAVTLRAEDALPNATAARGPVAPVMELLLVDAQTGALLARPPAMPLAAVNAFFQRLGSSPIADPYRPPSFFGDPFP